MKIGLLECDHVAEPLRHIAGDYREMFAAWLGRAAPQVSWEVFEACRGQFPASLDACDAYLCGGSRSSVYDDAGWIHSLKDFVRRASETGRPFVGICFGHQMIAEALGGRTARAAGGWGVGAERIELVRTEAWMQPPRPSCRLQFMHQDQVESMPGQGVLLGRSAHCPVAMFRVGRAMLGIQAHPEFPAAYGEALILGRAALIGDDRARAAGASLSQKIDGDLMAGWVAGFLAAHETGRAEFHE